MLVVNPFPTAFVLTLRGDGVKRALDAAGYPYEDLVATGDQGQNLSLISAALQADPAICGVAALGNPAANPAGAVHRREQPGYLRSRRSTSAPKPPSASRTARSTMAINQQPFLQSYFAVANLANQAKYSLTPANVDTGTSIVTQGQHRRRCRPASTPAAAELSLPSGSSRCPAVRDGL